MNKIQIENSNYEVIGIFDVGVKTYCALLSLDGNEDIYLYEYRQYENSYELYDIKDDEEFEIVSKEFTFIEENQLFDN